MYVAAVDLADRPGATELAQVATPERDAIVDAGLMDAVLRGTDTSAWTSDDVAVANAALDRINQAITDASSLIDGYLARRYTLPLANMPGIVRVWATALVRYLLHKDRRSLANDDPIVRDYNDAIKSLVFCASGTLSLGAQDTEPSGAMPQVQSKSALFDRDCGTLKDFYGNL